MVPLWTGGGAGRLVSLATQGCWGPKFLSSPPAVRSVPKTWLELLTCPPPPPATCTGGQGDQRVVKSKPECHGVCRKQPGPEQGPGGGRGWAAPSLMCPHAHVALGGRDPGSPSLGLGPHPHGVRQPPGLSTGPAGWGGQRKAPRSVQPWPSPRRAGLRSTAPELAFLVMGPCARPWS